MAVKRAKSATSTRKKVKRAVARAIGHIEATFNNTRIVLTDMQGNVLVWSTAGKMGFKGSRKGTPFAAQEAVGDVLSGAEEYKVETIEVRVQGPGQGRESAVRAFNSRPGINVSGIIDVTPLPHNGCRKRKKRRV